MSLIEMNVASFSDALATKEPVPGGGGVSALVAALGTGLGTMVGALTVGKKKYAEVEGEVYALMKRAESLRHRLMALVDEDATAFAPLARAYSIPKDDPNRGAIMEECLRNAAAVPLEIAQLACEGIMLHQAFAEKGSVLAISDAGTGVIFCWAALYGAALNVLVNTKSMADRAYAQQLNEQVQKLMDDHWKIAEEVYEGVRRRLL